MVSDHGSLCGWVPKEGSETIAAGRDDSPASLEDWRARLFTSPFALPAREVNGGLGASQHLRRQMVSA